MPKRDVLALCEKYSIPFVNDSTNTDTDYSRNLIRASVIPALERLSDSPQRAAGRCSELLRDDEAYLTDLAQELIKSSLSEHGGLSAAALAGAPRPLRYRALRLYSKSRGLDTLQHVHYDALYSLIERAKPHSSIDLPNSFEARIEGGELFIAPGQKKRDEGFCFESELHFGTTVSDDGRFMIVVERKNHGKFKENTDKFKNIYNLSTEIYLNSATIKGYCFFRTKKEADVILHGGMHKKLRKLFGASAIHPELRARLPLLCDGDGIVWAPFCAVRDGSRADKENADIKISLFIDTFR
jgi:tRNA(Ile)-lysidine synthase